MFPEPFFGFIHLYGVMIGIGLLFAFFVFSKYCKKLEVSKEMHEFVVDASLLAIIVGFISAALFQSFYEYLENPEYGFRISGNITFIGGLIGGVICFFIKYYFYKKKNKQDFFKVLKIAPCCITIAHAFGRIGCFCAGCCYGKPTDSWLGVKFPDLPVKVHPTQLYESFFLFLLFGLLTLLLLKKKGYLNLPLYLVSYGIFRFFLEFLRDDSRGKLIGSLTPSQFWSLLMVIAGIILGIIFINKEKNLKSSGEVHE